MVDHLLESYIAFQQLQEEAKESGLTLEYSGRRFTLIAGESRKVEDLNGNITDASQMDVSGYSFDTIRACIRTWTFCRDYHEYDKKHQAPTVD